MAFDGTISRFGAGLLLLALALQLGALSLTRTPDTLGLEWASRVDTCALAGLPVNRMEYTTTFYAGRFCVALEGVEDRGCDEYDEMLFVHSATVADAHDSFVGAAAVSQAIIYASVGLFLGVLALLLAPASESLGGRRSLTFKVIYLVMATVVAGASASAAVETMSSPALRGNNDLYLAFAPCEGGPKEIRLGYGAAVHAVLIAWMVAQALLVVSPPAVLAEPEPEVDETAYMTLGEPGRASAKVPLLA